MTLTDEHLRLAIRHIAQDAPCKVACSLFAPGASVSIGLGVASIVVPGQLTGPILHLGEPCPAFQSVPMMMSLPHPQGWCHVFFRAIPFAALGLSHEAAA